MTIDIDKLRKDLRAGLEGVTPEKWFIRTNRHTSTDGRPWGWLDAAPPGGPQKEISGVRVTWTQGDASEANARHIALASPQNVAALLDHIDRLEAKAVSLGNDVHALTGEASAYRSRVAAAEARAEAAEKERDEWKERLQAEVHLSSKNNNRAIAAEAELARLRAPVGEGEVEELVKRLNRVKYTREAWDEPYGTYDQPCDADD